MIVGHIKGFDNLLLDPVFYFLTSTFILIYVYIPVFVIYFNHFSLNKDSVIAFDDENKLYSYSDRSEVVFSPKDVKIVFIYKPKHEVDNRGYAHPWSNMKYALIELNCGRVIFLSSIMVPNPQRLFRNLPIEVKSYRFPFVKRKSLKKYCLS
ncbi:hypothetical protein PEPS_24340 [Persicobacter psychrovividus]|uniref:PH domain-containing protein n=1 Tax=Persicobacter psychrovividus TaxID=387638 RepID=A0ABM7VGR1_9BACT|nr:hypothetical protein PEPS_24340 [Persicobacter psychrovividus]